MPSAEPAESGTIYTARAKYWSPNNAFKAKLPEVPSHMFIEERDRAFNPKTGTAEILLDLSDRLQCSYPATTPNMLARYARIAGGEKLRLEIRSSGESWYVIEGAADFAKGDDRISAGAGDIVVLPGGGETELHAPSGDAVLLAFTDEPALAFLRVGPPAPGQSAVQAAHYTAIEINRQLESHYAPDATDEDRAGRAVLFTGEGVEATQTVTACIALAMNSLEPGGDQTPHRHNAAALTLALECDGVYSEIEGKRVEWQKHAVMLTPPTALHAHHNRGKGRMVSLVAQDGGLFYNARAVGFSFG
jgi:gentisate 1,2-dioxygenase